MDTLIDTDPWAWWRAALAEPDRRKRPSADVNRPAQGFYRVKDHGHWTPVAFWYEGGDEQVTCMRGDEFLEVEEALKIWTWACDHPISEETYNLVINGGRWPDLDETVEEQVSRGHNQPPEDELTQFKIDIENAAAAVERYKQIGDDETSQKAQSARARLNELARNAKKKHDELKAPHLAECRRVDGSWNPLVDAAKAAADAIGRAMSAWENKKAALQREQEEAAQREADRAIAAGTPPAAQEAPPTQSAPAPATQIKGGYGRAAAVQVVKVIAKVTDYRALALHYIENDSVKSVIMHLASTDVKNGHELPGVLIGTERKVR